LLLFADYFGVLHACMQASGVLIWKFCNRSGSKIFS